MNFYLRNALGFFLQVYPCALMSLLPFPQGAYRFRRRYIFFWITVIAAALAALYPAALCLRRRSVSPWHTFLPDLLIFAAFPLMLFACVLTVRETLLKKILVFSIVLFYAAAQFSLVNLLLPFLPWSTDLEGFAYSQNGLVLFAATAALLMPLMLAAVIRPLGEYIQEIEPMNMRREFFAATVSTVIYCILTIYCDTAYYSDIGKAGAFQRYLLPMLLFLTLNQILTYWLVFRESIRRKRDHERQRFLEVRHLQYEKIASEMENTRRLRHDLRHHLNVLGALNAQGRRDEITKYLKQYGAVYDHLNGQKFSGDPVVDGVLEYYLTMAGKEETGVKCHVSLSEGGSGVEAMDMTVLLGNCLENAMEAMRALAAGERRLSIEMAPARSMILLRVQNTCAGSGGSGEPAGWEDFAVRREKDIRSVGLQSIAVIAEKYGGSAQFQRQNGVFTTRVILNPKQER